MTPSIFITLDATDQYVVSVESDDTEELVWDDEYFDDFKAAEDEAESLKAETGYPIVVR